MKNKITSVLTILAMGLGGLNNVMATSLGDETEYFKGKVGIGVLKPVQALEVNGHVLIKGGGPQTGYVLTSDDRGLASWQAIGNVPYADKAGAVVNGSVSNSEIRGGTIEAVIVQNMGIKTVGGDHTLVTSANNPITGGSPNADGYKIKPSGSIIPIGQTN